MLCDNLEGWDGVRWGGRLRGRFKTEKTYVYLRLIHVDVWQKPTQYYKLIILQLKISKFKKKNRSNLHVFFFSCVFKINFCWSIVA